MKDDFMKKNKTIEIGHVVRSVAGRDRKRVFLVVGIDENDPLCPIEIANGELRSLDDRKHKNPRHLQVIATVSDDERNALKNGMDDCLIAAICRKYDIIQ